MSDFDLETLVRAAKPEPKPQWVGRMDRVVAEGFRRPPRWWHWQQLRLHMVAAGAATSVVGVLVVVVWGISSESNLGSSDDSSGSSASAPAMSKAPGVPETSSATGSSSSSSPSATVSPPRAQIKNVSLTLSTTAAEVESVSDKAIAVADDLGGYVQDSSVTARKRADITLRVPQDRLQQALTQLSRLGHVSSRTQSIQDVTDQRAQLDADVRDARAYRDSLRTRLGNAKTDRETSSLRGRLTRAEQTLRRRERDVAKLSGQTSTATIDLTIRGNRKSGPAAAAPPAGRWGPGDALHDAGRVLAVVAGVALIGLAVLAPVAILVAIGVALNRLLTRRRRERALELA
jgi:hypothetical protein